MVRKDLDYPDPNWVPSSPFSSEEDNRVHLSIVRQDRAIFFRKVPPFTEVPTIKRSNNYYYYSINKCVEASSRLETPHKETIQ